MEAQIRAFVKSQRDALNPNLDVINVTKKSDDTLSMELIHVNLDTLIFMARFYRLYPQYKMSILHDMLPGDDSVHVFVTVTFPAEERKKLWRKVAEQHYPDYLFLFGLSEAVATAVLKEKDMHLEVIERDGKKVNDGYGDRMIDHTRVRVYVEAGKIVGIDSVGY